MATTEMLSFDDLERFVSRAHPDPNGERQQQADTHGSIVSMAWLCVLLGTNRRKIETWRAKGINVWDADIVAIRLGRYPSTIWPQWDLIDLEPEQLDFEFFQTLKADALAESYRLREAANVA